MAFERISFEANNACNLQCAHCLREEIWTRTENVHIAPALVDKVLGEARRMYATKTVVFTGGEVPIHPKLTQLIDICCDHGLTWQITTNGIRKEPIAKLLRDERRRDKLGLVAISIDGASEESHDRIRGQGSFRKTMKTIAYLHAIEAPVCLKLTIAKHNVHELEDLAMLGAKLGVKLMNYSPLHLTPDAFEADLVLPPDAWHDIYDRLDRVHSMLRVPHSFCAGGPEESSMRDCEAYHIRDVHVDYRGHLSLCCVLPAYRGQGDGEEKDIVADLNTESLAVAHERLVELVAEVNRHRIQRLKDNSVHELDKFLCFSCEKFMGKMGWLKDPKYADSPWTENLILPDDGAEDDLYPLKVQQSA